MILNKITHGFVIQSYDTKEQKWIGQDFVAGDDVEWEKEGGFLIAVSEVPEDVLNNYLPFHMEQP